MTETEKQMLPDVAEYIATVDGADRAWSAMDSALNAMYPDRHAHATDNGQAQFQAYWAQYDEYEERYKTAHFKAWAKLKESADPLVAWVAKNCGTYKAEARVFLAALPATGEELDALARREEWCDAWVNDCDCCPDEGTGFRDRMIEAGVFPA